jgi:hypothetical protein
VLYAGSYQGLREVEKLIEGELERLAGGWGESAASREIRATAFGEDRLGAARRRLAELPGSEPAAAELAIVQGEVDGRFASWKRSVSHLLEQGRPGEAWLHAQALVTATEGFEPWTGEVRSLLVSLETNEAEAERALEAKLVKLLQPLESKPPRKGIAEKLRRFADEAGAAQERLAKRARRIADAAAYALEEL